MKAVETSQGDVLVGYQLGVVREVLLALLTKRASHGYQLRAELALALGPLAHALTEGQVYVTLRRLEQAGLVEAERIERPDGRERKVYALTGSGRERVTAWLEDTSWLKPAPAEFHVKLVAAAATGLADPVQIVRSQRHELLSGLREAQRATFAEPAGSVAALLLDGVVLRLQADLRWLDQCSRYWAAATRR